MRALEKHLETKKHIIWDWNGTLLDDVDMVVGAMSEVMERYGMGALTREAYTELFGFPVSKYYERIGFDFTKTPFEEISKQFVQNYMRDIWDCRLHEGVAGFLSDMKTQGRSQSILSAAHEDSLHKHLKHFQIESYFDRVYALNDHNAVGKLERGRQLLKDCGFSPEESVLIGDTDHDLEVGQELGVDVVLLGDGHQAPTRLSAVHHTVVIQRG
ncbi:HAD family hydrolase [bacterium]|nr:HAD family hydrolase [bacterium]